MGDSGTMVSFGHKQAWLAVREGDPAAVIAALGGRDLGSVSWWDGVNLAYTTGDRVAVTPPVPGAGGAGWVLAAGRWLVLAEPPDVAELSVALATEVQLFVTHRVAELHRWRRAAGGKLVRGFGFVGERAEVLEWYGAPDSTEQALGLPPEPDVETDLLVNEDDVMRVAAAWSVDPSALDGLPAPGPLRLAAVS